MGRLGDQLASNLKLLRQALGDSDDVIVRKFLIGGRQRAALIFIEGLVDEQTIQRDILHRLMLEAIAQPQAGGQSPVRSVQALAERVVTAVHAKPLTQVRQMVEQVLAGQTVLLVDGLEQALLVKTQQREERGVQSPVSESVVRGPQEGFTENVQVNVALVRRRVKDPRLCVKHFIVGERSRTKVVVLYVRDLAPPEVVGEVTGRIERIRTAQVLETGMIEEMITGRRISPFPVARLTERPDKTAAALNGGRVAVLVEGSPGALLVPTVLLDMLIAADDYSHSPAVVVLMRLVRFLGVALVLFLPGLYISLAAYNPDALHIDSAMAIAASREGVPLPAVLEVVLMELMMEMLLEATVRLPTKVGSAVTVVGGLIIGRAAAEAKLISNAMVVIVAATTIGSYTQASYEAALALRLSKWLIIAGAAVFGLFGMFLAILLLLVYQNSITSFGVPYLAPFAPPIPRDLARDSLFRRSWWSVQHRSRTFGARDRRRAVGTGKNGPQDGDS